MPETINGYFNSISLRAERNRLSPITLCERSARNGRFFARTRLFLFALLMPLFIFASASGAYAAASGPSVRIAVTSPWLYEVASFIGGRQAAVRSLATLTASGGTQAVSRPRGGELVIAFDPQDAARFRLGENNKNLRVLYKKTQMNEAQLRAAFFDPAMLPFIAQEIMKIIAAADQNNYGYYQRRLAEFQSRIDSTMGVGRHLLGDEKMLDLTGAAGTWVRSAIAGVVRPPANVWSGWLNGDSKALRAALDEASRRGWLLLLDPWTPTAIRNAASAYPYRLTLPTPPQDVEFFVFLHEIFTSISNKIKAGAQKKKA